MDKYRPCPSIIAMFTSDSQHPPRSRHAVYLGVYGDIKLDWMIQDVPQSNEVVLKIMFIDNI